MRIAVCDNRTATAEQMCAWVRQYGALYGLNLNEVRCFTSPESFLNAQMEFQVVFMGFGGSEGFRAAQQLRSRDHRCRIILVDDTMEYSLRGMRLHCTNFVLRPVEFRHIVQSMHLVMGGRIS